jgi:hypothetical protein
MPTTIKLKNSVTTTNAPSSLAQGEVAINVTDKKVWVGNAATTPVQLLGTGADGFFSSITDAGNLTFTGTGNRILGDFTNATLANRVLLQSSTSNGQTAVGLIPNGTSTQSQVIAFNSTDPANSSYIQTLISNTEARINSGQLGTGTNLPLTMYTGGSERLRIDTSGNVLINTTTNPDSGKLTIAGRTVMSVSGSDSFTGTLYFSGNGSANPFNIQNTASGGLAFWNFNGSWLERMRIDSAGKVLVGGTTAVYPGSSTRGALEINGSAESILSLTIGGSTTNSVYIYNQAASVEYYSQGTRPVVWNQNGTERMRIDSSGNLLVGCTGLPSSTVAGRTIATGYFQSSQGSGTTSYTHFYFTNGNGNVGTIVTSGSGTAYNTSSDYRLKENIAPMTGALGVVQQLKPVTYNWKVDGSSSQGFIAHELQAVVPDCVTGEKDAVDADGKPVYQGIDTSFLVATLTAAIQEQQAMIETLTTRLNALEGK